jgi:predicted restriction endonuclease
MTSRKEFVGCEALKARQAQHLATFERCVAQNNFAAIHHDHFDWWMFPIDEKSSFGYQFSITKGIIIY